jgi:hypothetical protein
VPGRRRRDPPVANTVRSAGVLRVPVLSLLAAHSRRKPPAPVTLPGAAGAALQLSVGAGAITARHDKCSQFRRLEVRSLRGVLPAFSLVPFEAKRICCTIYLTFMMLGVWFQNQSRFGNRLLITGFRQRWRCRSRSRPQRLNDSEISDARSAGVEERVGRRCQQ